MLIPVGLKGKERAAYIKQHKHQDHGKSNVGPKSGLRPVGGDEAVARAKRLELEAEFEKLKTVFEEAAQTAGELALVADAEDATDEAKEAAETAATAASVAEEAVDIAFDALGE